MIEHDGVWVREGVRRGIIEGFMTDKTKKNRTKEVSPATDFLLEHMQFVDSLAHGSHNLRLLSSSWGNSRVG